MRHTKMPTGILTCLALSWTLCLESPAAETGVGLDQVRGWKWDVTIYDRPGWVTPWMTAPRLIGDEIVIRCTSHPDDVYVDDFYAEKSETVTLAYSD